MTRRTINVDGADYCADVTGSLPGNMTIANAVAGACQTTPPPPPPPPPSGERETSGAVHYPPNGTVRTANLTLFSDVWGRGSVTSPPVEFPGQPSSSPAINTLGSGKYIAAMFTVPADMPTNKIGYFKGVTYNTPQPGPGPDLLVAINENPGDFTGARHIRQNDGDGYWWTTGTGTAFRKQLEAGRSYHLNIKFADPNASGVVHLANVHN